MQARKLEEFKIFPLVAWFLVISFSAFTISLTQRLTDEIGISGYVREHVTQTQTFLGR